MFKQILVPTDGSQLSKDAAQRAVLFAKELGARITALYVKPPTVEYSWANGVWVDFTNPALIDEFVENDTREILGSVEMLCWKERVICNKVARSSGAVYEEIIEVAAACGCDLIFMASHGRHGISALVLGSETQKVLTHSKIPVLVYR